MRTRLHLILAMTFIFTILPAQEQDTLPKMRVALDEVVVTATRTKRRIEDVPAQVHVISSKEIEQFPVSNVDDLLRSVANVNVNRSWGIFSKNSSVTMRGLGGSAHTLVLVDGVPKNKIAGGSVNWHNINPDHIERIEVINGPASSLYGNNAMGGVINIITKTPVTRLGGSAGAFYGKYNTRGSSLNLMGSEHNGEKGFYWSLNSYYRKGDGYVLEVPEFIDESDVATALKEYGGGARIGYRFDAANSIEINCDYYDEMRGSGIRVFEEDGSYESYVTSQIKAKYTGKIGKTDISALLYYANELFFGQKESLNDYKEYKLFDSYSDKTDKGFWTTCSNEVVRNNYVTLGAEMKFGDVDGRDIYRTSTDEIHYGSRMDILGFFIQDEFSFLKNRFKLIAGLRTDLVRFYDGYQSVVEPTSVTGFQNGFSESFKNKSWTDISPKIALQYSISSKSRIYASVGEGFIPPDLKDLSQTGKIQKGFRLANPDLKPEILTNYELGYAHHFSENWKVNTAIYYSSGKDFLYMIGTGDSVDTGGSSLKPVLKPDNVAGISVTGCELSSVYTLGKNLSFQLSYSYNDSKITRFANSAVNSEKDLTGKHMVEVSPNLFYAGVNYRNRYFSINVNGSYVDKQWFDDENTILINDYFVANTRISTRVKHHFRFYFDIQNIFNTKFIDRKGQLSPGRFMVGGFQYVI